MIFIGVILCVCTIALEITALISLWGNPFIPGFIVFLPNSLFHGIYLCTIQPSEKVYESLRLSYKWDKNIDLTEREVFVKRKKIGLFYISWSVFLFIMHILFEII